MTALSFSGGAAVQWVGRMSAAMRSLVIPVSDMGAAKKVYTGVTAAALRAKDCMMDAVTTVRENAEEQNERRAAELAEEVVEDALLSNPKAGRTGEIIIIKAEEAGPIEG